MVFLYRKREKEKFNPTMNVYLISMEGKMLKVNFDTRNFCQIQAFFCHGTVILLYA